MSSYRPPHRRVRSWLRALAGVVLVGAAAVVALALSGGDPPARLPRNAVAVDVARTPSGPAIHRGFVGLSVEYTSLLPYAGADPSSPNPLLVRLIRDLTPHGSPVIRVGGDTTDWTWWPVSGVAKPPGVSYALTPRWIAVARATARALRARLILGINLEADSGRIAGAEAHALLAGIGTRWLAGFELGNEPEAYGTIGWYTNARGVSVPGRPPDYGVNSYIADYAAISRWLPAAVPLVGPALASTDWLGHAAQFLDVNPRVRLLTFHFYPLRRCGIPPSSVAYPTISHLLAPAAASPSSFQAAVAAAHARGVAVRVDELNSVSCKGKPGVSDSFASALWALDALFRMAQAGVDGVNVHTLTHVSYQPFVFTHRAGRWQVSVKPLYYGLLAFDRAAPPGSRLLPTYHAVLGGLETWATGGPNRTVRVLMINDSPVRRLTLAVRSAGGAGSAVLQRLNAPSLAATSGVTLAGQRYGGRAQLTGRRRTLTLQPVQGRYVVALPAASAALLTIGDG